MGIALGAEIEEPAVATEPAAAPIVASEEKPRQGNQPFCPRHAVQMVSYSSSDMFTYYKCPEPMCNERDKKVRPVGPFKNLYGHGTSARKEGDQ